MSPDRALLRPTHESGVGTYRSLETYTRTRRSTDEDLALVWSESAMLSTRRGTRCEKRRTITLLGASSGFPSPPLGRSAHGASVVGSTRGCAGRPFWWRSLRLRSLGKGPPRRFVRGQLAGSSGFGSTISHLQVGDSRRLAGCAKRNLQGCIPAHRPDARPA